MIEGEAESVRVVSQALNDTVEALDEAIEELQETKPDPSRLQRIGQTLLSAALVFGKYCVGLGDVALKKAAEELGSTGTKWAIRAPLIF